MQGSPSSGDWGFGGGRGQSGSPLGGGDGKLSYSKVSVKRGLRVNRSVRYWSGCRGDPCGRPLCRSYLVSNAIANAGDHKGRPYRSSEVLGTGLCKGLREAGTGDLAARTGRSDS